MILLYVKGRGYYNGHRVSNYYDWARSREEGNENKTFRNESYKVTFKRDANQVKSTNTFNSVEDAEQRLQDIRDLIAQGSYYEDTHTNYRKQLHTTCTTHDASVLEKFIDKIEVTEVDDYLVFKKTNRINLQRKMSVSKAHGDNFICDACRINLTPEEPYVSMYGTACICIHCIEQGFNMVKPDFDRHPNAEEITKAWKTEMLTREI